MEWWQSLLAIGFVAALLYLFVMEVIISPIIDNTKYRKKALLWDQKHPGMVRIQCKDCKYCKSETHFQGRYPNGIPKRVPKYCSYLKRSIKPNSFCMIAEPTTEFYISIEKMNIRPISDAKIYYSAFGSCYHSSLDCPSIRNSQHKYISVINHFDRRPCPKCWKEINGALYPKK